MKSVLLQLALISNAARRRYPMGRAFCCGGFRRTSYQVHAGQPFAARGFRFGAASTTSLRFSGHGPPRMRSSAQPSDRAPLLESASKLTECTVIAGESIGIHWFAADFDMARIFLMDLLYYTKPWAATATGPREAKLIEWSRFPWFPRRPFFASL